MFHVEQSEFWASGSMGGAAARIAEKLSNKKKSRRPTENLKFPQTIRVSRDIKMMLKGNKAMQRYEQNVCSTWNNRRFSVSISVDGAAARIAEELSNKEKEPPPHRKLEVTESLRKGGKVQDRVRL